MPRLLLVLNCLLYSIIINAQTSKMLPNTPFEQDNKQTATYAETISFYEAVANQSDYLTLHEVGTTDSGKPLQVLIISEKPVGTLEDVRDSGNPVLFINNAIHPGEPCGVDASMLFIKRLLAEKSDYLKNITIAIVPFYNIGGGLNRNSHTRVNQIGPIAYGFRGNAKNLDLNRDFVKCDSENAKAFNQLFHKLNPEVFIDNHTSNGADYQYTMTLIPTQHNKMDKALASSLNSDLMPYAYKEMKQRNWEMTPYVYARKQKPDDGIIGFFDAARYSSGYAALFNTISFMPETHMLKPYVGRVESTLEFMDIVLDWMHERRGKVLDNKKQADLRISQQEEFVLQWELDTEKEEKFLFKGYEAGYKPSKVSGLERLYYDRNKPYEREIPFFNSYKPVLTVQKPIAYVIPSGYKAVIERLKWNGAKLTTLKSDRELEVEMYYIRDYKSTPVPYEGHFLHSDVEVEKIKMTRQFYKGDIIVETNQPVNKYIVEHLEPQGMDSFFAWNFFDGVLQQKEYFSAYVFEDLAAEILENDDELRKALDEKKANDAEFAKNANAQLYFIYQQTQHYEKTHNLYPVGRLNELEQTK